MAEMPREPEAFGEHVARILCERFPQRQIEPLRSGCTGTLRRNLEKTRSTGLEFGAGARKRFCPFLKHRIAQGVVQFIRQIAVLQQGKCGG